MKLEHEDLVFWLIVIAATAVAGLLALAVAVSAWPLGWALFTFAMIALCWFGALVPVTVYYHRERDQKVLAEKQRWEEEEQRRLERAVLEAKTEDPDDPKPKPAHRERPKGFG